jgi:hypothetical protein
MSKISTAEAAMGLKRPKKKSCYPQGLKARDDVKKAGQTRSSVGDAHNVRMQMGIVQ